jgi:hypothetical protein
MSIDQSMLKVILENHILKLKHTLSELYNGQLLETISGKLLRVFIYRTVSMCVGVCVCVLKQRELERKRERETGRARERAKEREREGERER